MEHWFWSVPYHSSRHLYHSKVEAERSAALAGLAAIAEIKLAIATVCERCKETSGE